jgi:hypothetical protein
MLSTTIPDMLPEAEIEWIQGQVYRQVLPGGLTHDEIKALLEEQYLSESAAYEGEAQRSPRST